MRLVLLISGKLGQNCLERVLTSDYVIEAVFTDAGSKEIIRLCQVGNLPLFIGNPRKERAVDFISNLVCDVVISVNYLFIVSNNIINLPKKMAVNIHGSLLPKYRGRTPHVWAIINGEKYTGITVHKLDLEVDAGDILYQLKIPIEDTDTGGSILKKFELTYDTVIFDILKNIEENDLTLTRQMESMASYFGKRTEKDGLIDWNWCRERIYDWVRAQTKPYPGAFTYLNGRKIKVFNARYNDLGFHYKQENGLVLLADPDRWIIKTPNGSLELFDLEIEKGPPALKGEILG